MGVEHLIVVSDWASGLCGRGAGIWDSQGTAGSALSKEP